MWSGSSKFSLVYLENNVVLLNQRNLHRIILDWQVLSSFQPPKSREDLVIALNISAGLKSKKKSPFHFFKTSKKLSNLMPEIFNEVIISPDVSPTWLEIVFL